MKRAVKIYNKSNMRDIDLIRVKQEVAILEELDHPHIIKLHETFGEINKVDHEVDDHSTLSQKVHTFQVVMEHCSGGTVYNELMRRGGKLRESKALLIFT